MSIRCRNGSYHTHESVAECRRCWFPNRSVPFAASTAPAPAPYTPNPYQPAPGVRMSTERQQKYIHDLGGDALHAAKLTFDEASAMIDRLKRERRQNRTAVTDPRLDLLKGMIDMVPEGYYATRPDENNHVDFLAIRKVTKPTKKFPVGTAKFQSQHSERWEEELVLWPSGQWSVYNHRYISVIMEVVADYKTCAQRYSIELQRCMRCNTELTDDRSRHYLVGPECETKHGFTWPIAYADEMNGGLSFEQLVARGMETRVWQQRALPASR